MIGAVAKLRALIGLDDTEFKAGTRRVTNAASTLQQTMRGVGSAIGAAFSIGAVVSLGKKAIDLGGQLADLSAKSGLSTDALQVMGKAAAESGSSMDAVAAATVKLRRAQVDAESGAKAQADAFARLGISLDEIRGMSPDQLFDRVAKAMEDAQGSSVSLDAGAVLLGNSVSELGGVFGAVAAGGLQAFIDAQKELGKVLNDETVAALDAAGDRIDDFNTRLVIGAGKAIGAFENLGKAIGYAVMGQGKLAWNTAIMGEQAALNRMAATGGPTFAKPVPSGPAILPTGATEPATAQESKADATTFASSVIKELVKDREKIQEDISAVDRQTTEDVSRITGRGVNADEYARVGGAIGGYRPDIAVADRQMRIQQMQLDAQKRIAELANQEVQLLNALRAAINGDMS